jgi:hypothetical protein
MQANDTKFFQNTRICVKILDNGLIYIAYTKLGQQETSTFGMFKLLGRVSVKRRSL